MSHHLNGVQGLLAPTRIFYVRDQHAETGAYALEWINAFAHLDQKLRDGLVLHGGTLAQLHLNEFQRLSRDVDLIGSTRGPIEVLLGAIAARYGRRLFRWEEVAVADADLDMQRFSVFFPSAKEEGVLVPLRVDVTYLPVHLPTQTVRLGASKIYVPTNANDGAETLTPAAFIADKLPTLGFETLGYRRGGEVLGHPEQIWKQLHDISSLIPMAGDLAVLPGLYEESVRARNAARKLNYSVAACLADVWRVSLVAVAAAAYPNNDDRVGDERYADDVQELRRGLGGYRAYCLRPPIPMEIATRCGLLARGLLAVSRAECSPEVLSRALARVTEVHEAVRHSEVSRKRLAAVFGRPQNPPGWSVPVASRLVFGLRPSAAIAAYLAGRLPEELDHYARNRRFSFEDAEG